MNRAKLPETFGLDRLDTPIGVALLVSDDDGVLRALDWEDYEQRMKDLLRLQYGDQRHQNVGNPDHAAFPLKARGPGFGWTLTRAK